MTTTTQTIALDKLILWPGNVRRTDADTGIGELAASIASHGLLNPLLVRKDKRGKFAVIAGQRRLLALQRLAAQERIDANSPIECRFAGDEVSPAELSLAENVVRVAMHPADEFEAFRDLIDKRAMLALAHAAAKLKRLLEGHPDGGGICALAALACAWLLLQAYARSRYRLLLWGGVCFSALTLNNILLVVDKVLLPMDELSTIRLFLALSGMIIMLYGLIWDTE